jgi:hypothetical protein
MAKIGQKQSACVTEITQQCEDDHIKASWGAYVTSINSLGTCNHLEKKMV